MTKPKAIIKNIFAVIGGVIAIILSLALIVVFYCGALVFGMLPILLPIWFVWYLWWS